MTQGFTAAIWQEGPWFIAQCREADVASQGESEEDALQNLREALQLHFSPPRATRLPHARRIEVELDAAQASAIVPRHREVAVGTLRSILSQAGVTQDEFNAL